ncbi:MAG: hypothetical protein KC613_27410, partial [Myxococcales bacterium]|nr:hypothetical protein [Myxococcales bacterium]
AWRQALELPVEALDATRLTAEADAQGVTVTVAGDGMLAVRDRHTQALRWWRVVCPAGAPPYPAYGLDAARREAWRAAFGDARQVHAEGPGGPVEVTDAPGFDPLTWRFHWADIDLVALFSDGVEQVRQPAVSETSRTYTPVEVPEIIGDLLAIPFAHGQFVQRRARRALDRWTALGWRPFDDLGVAMIACPDAPTDGAK